MKKVLKMSIVLTFMLFILTGCTNTEYNVKINKNGSGKVEYSVNFDEKILKENNIDLVEFEDMKFLDNVKKTAEENGYTIEDIKKDDATWGYKASKEFEKMEDFKIKDSINNAYVDILDDTGLKIEKSFFKTKYSQSFKVDVSKKSNDLINEIKLTYDLPNGKVVTNTAQETSRGNVLTWTIKGGETVEVSYCVESINILPVIGIILGSMLIIAVVVWPESKSREKKNDEKVEIKSKEEKGKNKTKELRAEKIKETEVAKQRGKSKKDIREIFLVLLTVIAVVGVVLPYATATNSWKTYLQNNSEDYYIESIDMKNSDVLNISFLEYAKIYIEGMQQTDYAVQSIICFILILLLSVSSVLMIIYVKKRKYNLLIIFNIITLLCSFLLNFDMKDRGVLPSSNYNCGISYYLYYIICLVIFAISIRLKKIKNDEK